MDKNGAKMEGKKVEGNGINFPFEKSSLRMQFLEGKQCTAVMYSV